MNYPYQMLTEYEGGNWKQLLEQLGLLEVFGELLGNFNSPDSARKIIRYIVWTYSVNSDRIIAGQDWEANKYNNFVHAGLPKDLWEEIGMLKDVFVARAIYMWLEYQDMPIFKQIQCLKDLKMEMQISAVTRIEKASGEVDYDQKYKNAQYAVDLEKMIKQLETQVIQNNPAFKDAVRETKQVRKTVTGPEAFSH